MTERVAVPARSEPGDDQFNSKKTDHTSSSFSLLGLIAPLAEGWRWLLVSTLLAGAATYGVSQFLPPTYVSQTTFMPPPQQQSGASLALSSVGSLPGLISGAGVRTSADQYSSFLQSKTVLEQVVGHFDLKRVYRVDLQADALRILKARMDVSIGKRDGLITLSVEDADAQRAAAVANQLISELRVLADRLATTEAQQRREFFEGQLSRTREQLDKAQLSLQTSGFNPGALKVEPRAAADAYARLKASLTTAEVRLEVLRRSLTDGSAEIASQRGLVDAMREQLRRLEDSERQVTAGSDYISKYRDFRYQEMMLEVFAKQYELARLDETREGGIVQVVDPATPAERRSSPRPLRYSLIGAAAGLLVTVLWLLLREAWRVRAAHPAFADHVQRIRSAFRR